MDKKEKIIYIKNNWCKKKDCVNYPYISKNEFVYNLLCFHCIWKNKKINDFYFEKEKKDFYLEEEI